MHRDRKRRGAVMVFTAIVLMVLILIMGLGIDWGKIAFNVHQLQNAADAAALAGADKLTWLYEQAGGLTLTLLIDRAQEVAWENSAEQMRVSLRDNEQPDPFPAEGDESPYDVLVGQYLPQFRGTINEWRPTLRGANAVKAIARREGQPDAPPLRMLFGPIAGVPSVNAVRSAIAAVRNAHGAGLICLAPTGMGISVAGTSGLVVYHGDIQVNSIWEPCVDVGGNGTIDANAISMCGTMESATTYDFPVWEHAREMADPLAWVPDLRPLPPVGTAMKWDAMSATYVDIGVDEATRIIDNSLITTYGGIGPDGAAIPMLKLTPGYYPKGISLSNGAKLVLEPGVYAVGGNKGGGTGKTGLVATGGVLLAEDVMIYVTEDGAGNWGEINLNGGGAEIHISEYKGTAYPEYARAGLAVFQDRTRPAYSSDPTKAENNQEQPFFAGGNNSSFEGTVYLHNNSYTTVPEIAGGAGNIGIQVITDRLRATGNGDVIIDYDGRNNWTEEEIFIVR